MVINGSKRLVLMTAGLLVASMTHAQESANASGGDATGSGGTVAYSVGQLVYTSHTGSTGDVAQGVQQAYEIFSLDVPELASDLSLTIFPNPAAERLILQVGDYNDQQWTYQLYDMQGKLLNSGPITGEQTEINTQNLPASTYFMNIVSVENEQVKSFKIMKK